MMNLKLPKKILEEVNDIYFTLEISFEINTNEIIYFNFGMVEIKNKEVWGFCILINRTKENILLYIKNFIKADEYWKNKIQENIRIKTIIYSYCFLNYHVNNFKQMSHNLKCLNHFVWFGYGLFQINGIDSLCRPIKKLYEISLGYQQNF